MNKLSASQITNKLVVIASAMTSVFASGLACTKGGGINSPAGGAAGGGGAHTISITSTYPTGQGSSWTPVTSSSRIYIKGLEITILGTCSRGIATIKVDEGGAAYSETTTCSDLGRFTWSKTYTTGTEGDKTLTLQAYSAGGTAFSDGSTTVSVRIDNTAPAAPVVTTPFETPYRHVAAVNSYTISGTVTSDTVSLYGPAGVSVPISSGTWSYAPTLVDGASLDFSFYGYDLAGNRTATTTQTILWAASIYVAVGGSVPGGDQIADTGVSGSGFKIEGNAGQNPMGTTDSGTNFFLKTGFNELVNQLRSQ